MPEPRGAALCEVLHDATNLRDLPLILVPLVMLARQGQGPCQQPGRSAAPQPPGIGLRGDEDWRSDPILKEDPYEALHTNTVLHRTRRP